MKPNEVKAIIQTLCAQAKAIAETAKTAQRNRASLRGDNFYGRKFHDRTVALAAVMAKLEPALIALCGDGAIRVACDHLRTSCETLKSLDADGKTRLAALKQIDLACHTAIYPALDRLVAPTVPASEQVLPSSVVKGARGYLEKVLLQANGCYERGWFDAASVMIRKLIEILIVEVYESKSRAAEIKNADGDFFMLSGLVEKILGDATFNLSRETKRCLPLLKSLGDRSAHVRRYLATRDDIDKVTPGLRVVADDLLHLSGLK